MIDLVLDTMLDQQERMTFTLPVNDPKAEFVVEDVEVRHRGVMYFIRQVQKRRDGTTIFIDAECDALWYRLGELTIIGSIEFSSATVSAGLASALDGTGWSVGANTAATGSFTMEMEDASVLEVIRSWSLVTSTYVVWDTFAKTVDLVSSRGVDRGTGFRYGRNLTSIEKKSSVPYATKLYAYGADGLNIAGVNSGAQYLEDYSFYTNQGLSLAEARARFTKRRVFSDTTFLVDTELKAAAQEKLNAWAQGTVSYTCKVIDLQSLLLTSEEFEVGDRVRVRDSELGFDVQTTVVRTKRYPLQPWRDEVELAYLPTLIEPSAAPARTSSAVQWLLEGHNNTSELRLRNDGSYIANRIPLKFRTGGEAFFGYDVVFTGIGSGTLSVSALDAESDTLIRRVLEVPYTDGETIQRTMTWWEKELDGQKDYRIRMIAAATGGASAASGVNVSEEDSRLWVHYRGAVRQTPAQPNSVVYTYTGGVQKFTVPDDVTMITIEALGGGGGKAGSFSGDGGRGGGVTASFTVVPGTTYDVIVGGRGHNETVSPSPSYPNGGRGGGTGSDSGAGGGGSSDVRVEGGSLSDTLICAGGGGGSAESSLSNQNPFGGDAGFYTGSNGQNTSGSSIAYGATQFAGGAGGAGADGAFNQGGQGADSGSAFDFGGGGGGGGWYGGEGGALATGGGGGSGWVRADAFDILISDGANPPRTDGQVTISWEAPDDV